MSDDFQAILRTHAESMNSEGFYTVANALERAAEQIQELHRWRERECETQEALQAIGEEFRVRGGEPRVDGIRRVLTEQRDQLAALLREAGEGWRPIESAPKDGTVVLLYCPQGDGSPGSTYRVTAGNWESDPGGITEHRDLEGRYLGQDESDGWEGWMSWDGGFSEDTMMPTHWRPLPAPPAAGGKDGQ